MSGAPEDSRDPPKNNQNKNPQQNNVPQEQAPTDSDNSQQRTQTPDPEQRAEHLHGPTSTPGSRSLRGDDIVSNIPASSTPTDNFGRPDQRRAPANSNNPPDNNLNREPQQNFGPQEQVPVDSDNSQRRPQSPDSQQRAYTDPVSRNRDAVTDRETPQDLARNTRSRERLPRPANTETWHGITSATPPPSTPRARSLREGDSILDVPTPSTPRRDFGRPDQRRERTSDYHFERFDLDSLYMDYKTDIGFRLDFFENGADFEAAISATGFGRFHFCLLAITGLIYANTAVGITIISFVLPAATCDFRMTSADKGWLTAAPMLGMVIGSYFWGCLADTKGRKTVLVSTLLLDGFIGIISSFVQILPIFMACRFVNGFSVAGAMGICFPYLGEFQQTKYREKILCWMEMFWTLGVIVLPLIAWGIIPIEGIRIEHGEFSYDSWNWFVAACGVPSLCLGFWLLTFPESPKFMMECGDYDDALECLKDIYKINTGDDRNNYPIKSLKEKQRTTSVASQTSQKSVRSLKMSKPKDLKRLFSEIWVQTKALCRPPYLKYTVLTCFIQFGLTTSYYTLMIWFPELFNRYEEFESRFPNTSASVCDVSSIVVVDEASSDPFDCLKTIDQSVYMHTLIVGLACIPTSLWLPLCVHKLGAKFFLIFSLGFAGVVTVGLYYVTNSTQNLVLSCIFEALTSLAISLVFCVLVDLFPTNLRVMAAALSLTAGRGGGLIGNLSFGYLIDINCVIPIVVFAAFLFMAAVLCFFLPKTGQEALD